MNQFQLMREAELAAERAKTATHNPAAMTALTDLARMYAKLAETRALIGEDSAAEAGIESLPDLIEDVYAVQWRHVKNTEPGLHQAQDPTGQIKHIDSLRAQNSPLFRFVGGVGKVEYK